MRLAPPRSGRVALRFLAVSAVALATANCAKTPTANLASSGNGIDPKYGVKASPRLYNEGDVIPKGGGRRYTGKPYVVAGATYTPKENPRGYVREGLASWYGSAFHGRMTANGEVFDRHSIAAAHPTLPLPSYVRVTNLENHSSMIVRVNDRGPYHAGRVMDVSEETAEALGFHRKGTARVRVEYVGAASLAGSDDRKLLATLRTDGRPAGSGAPVMMADLGGSAETERFTRGATPLAFKPDREQEEAPAETRRPVRAPVVLASAAVAVPAAVQPTAARLRDFKPAPVAMAEARPAGGRAASGRLATVRTAEARIPESGPAAGRLAGHAAEGKGLAGKGAPNKDTPNRGAGGTIAGAPVRVAGLNPASLPSAPGRKAPAGRADAAPLRLSSAEGAPRRAEAGPRGGRSAPASMPPDAKLAMARLTAPSAAETKAGKPGAKKPEPAKLADKAPHQGARYAGIY